MKRIITTMQLILLVFVYGAGAAREPGPDLASFSVLALNSIYCKRGSEVLSGDLGVITATTGPWLAAGSEVTVGLEVLLHDNVAVYGDSIKIKANGSVDTIYYNNLVNNGTVRGESYSPLTFPLDVTLPDFPPPQSGTAPIILGRNETRVLGPGSYGKITTKQNSTLILSGGTYHLEELHIGLGAKLYFQEATELVINNRFAANANSSVMPEPDSNIAASDIYIYVNGTNGYNGGLYAFPKAVKFGVHNVVAANVYAPNGTIHLKKGTRAKGAFIGKDVLIGYSVSIELENGFSNDSVRPVAAWNGSGGTMDWHDPGNWQSHDVPGPVDHVIIPDLYGGTISLSTPAAIQSMTINGNSHLQLTAGSLQVMSEISVNEGATLEIIGGEVTGSDILIAAPGASLNLFGGSLASSGTIINNGTINIEAGDASLALNFPALINEGTVNWLSGDILLLSLTEINNQGAFNIQSDNSLQSVSPGSVLNNYGLLARTMRHGIADLALDFHNFGTLDIQSGTIRFSGDNCVNEQNGIMQGSGTVDVTEPGLLNAGIISPGNSPGILIIDGSFAQTRFGEFLIQLYAAAGDHIVVTGSCSLAGTLDISLEEGYAIPAGESIVMGTCEGGIIGNFDFVYIKPDPPSGQDESVTIGAHNITYESRQLYTLSVNKTGSGTGSVSSGDGSIDCGTVCDESYSAGTHITLNATAFSGAEFLGWSGACSGNVPCSIHINSDQTVTAIFGNKAVVPDVIGLELDSAVARITSAGLQIGSVDYIYQETIPQNQIYSQFPEAGSIVAENTSVGLTISGPDPTAAHLNADPSTLVVGESTTLTWSFGLSLSCSIEPDIGSVPCNGSLTISPTSTTTYTFTASDPELLDTFTSVALVVVGSPIADISANPGTIPPGESTTLFWSSPDADTCSIEPGIGAVDCSSGSQTITPAETTIYTITATGAGGITTASVVVEVVMPQPTASISGEPLAVNYGESVTLSWDSMYADSCSIDHGIGQVACASASQIVSPAETTTYTITAAGPGGTSTAQFTVVVNARVPAINSFTATFDSINAGEQVLLSWDVQYSDTLMLNNGMGGEYDVTGYSGANMAPVQTTTYTLTATGSGGTDSAQVMVTVNNQVDGVTIGGLVTDETTGLPIEGATVTVLDTDKSQSVDTLADGGYEISNITPGDADITVTAPGYDAQTLYYTFSAGTFSLDISLYREGTLAMVNGVVINAKTLLPEPGVEVSIYPTEIATVTDANGNFTLNQMEFGPHTLRITKEGFTDELSVIEVNELVEEVEIIAPIHFETGHPDTITADITGYVFDGVSGDPLAGAIVKTYQYGFETTTDQDGMYSFTGLPAGVIQFIAMAVGHEAVVTTVTVTPDGSSSLPMYLQPLTKGYVTGAITETETGQPIRNVTVSNGEAGLLAADSEADGTYTLVGIPEGVYSLTASHPEYLPAIADNITVNDQAETALDFTLAHKPVTGALEGTVSDKETSAPIADAAVTLVASTLTVTTDSNGYYYLPGLPAGLVTLTIEAGGYPATTRDTAVTADEDFETPTVITVDFELDAVDPTPPYSVSELITAVEGGVIESIDKQFQFIIPPDALTGDAIITLMPSNQGPPVTAGDTLQTDPALGLSDITALGSGTMLVIEPAVEGEPIPTIQGYVVISGRFSQAEADQFNIAEDSVFPYFWDGSNWTAMRIKAHENAVDRINNIPIAVVDFSTSETGAPITAGINIKERVMVAALADHIPDLEFARKPFFFFGGILGEALPISTNVNIYYSDELAAVTRFENLPPDDPQYRHNVLKNAMPLLLFHGWSPKSILLSTGWTDPNNDERYKFILEDLTEATYGVYRPVFITYNTRSRMKSVGSKVAELLHGKHLGGETVAGLGPERQALQFPYHDTMGYSKGGLIARNYLAHSNKPGSMVTIATPHHGTVGAAQDITTALGPAGITIDNSLKTWSPGTADLLDYNDRTGSLFSDNRQLSVLNKNHRSFPAAGDLTLIAGTDSDNFIGQHLLPLPNDRVVPAASVFGRTSSETDSQFASLLRVQNPQQHFKYEYMFPFNHYNAGTEEFSIGDNEDFKKAITNGLTDWATGRHVYGEQSEITDDSPYLEWVKYTVEVEYNVLAPEQHDTNCGLPETDCCATNEEYCAGNSGFGRNVRRLDRVALVVYALDEEGNWHIARGAATDGNRILTDARPIQGNSIDRITPLKFDYQNITFSPAQKILGTTYILLKLEPGENSAPPTPEGEALGGLL